jgi:transposase
MVAVDRQPSVIFMDEVLIINPSCSALVVKFMKYKLMSTQNVFSTPFFSLGVFLV